MTVARDRVRSMLPAIAIGAPMITPSPLVHAEEPVLREDASAAEVYESACAACHGPDGSGMPPTTLGFDVPMPDFRDCDFARREPDFDWYVVTHGGGPMRAFDRAMPAFEGALSERQMRAAIRHIRTFCEESSWPRGELNLPRPLVTTKAYPEDEIVLEVAGTTESPVEISTRLIYEQRIGPRSQIEAILPLNVGEAREDPGTSEDWRIGQGDLGFAFKHALVHSVEAGSIVSLGTDLFLPSGDEAEGFGGLTYLFEPFVAYGQIVPRAGFFQLQAGAELPTDDAEVAREAFWRATYGKSFNQGGFGRTFSPMIEVLGAREIERGGSTLWDVVPTLQATLNTRQHVRAALGARIPLSDRSTRPELVMIYVLWDWFDGGLFEGW